MDSSAVHHAFNYSVSAVSCVRSVSRKPCTVSAHNAAWPTENKSHIQGLSFGVSNPIKSQGIAVSCLKTSEASVAVKSYGSSKGNLPSATFPDEFEALILDVCHETEVAELKLKVGDFEMHLKRNISGTKASLPVASPQSPFPVRSEPAGESFPASPPSPLPPKSKTEKISPYTNGPVEKSAKLAAMEASGCSEYDLVFSMMVGSFRRGRTLKGMKQPPICKEGDVIKEGQVIGYMDQFGSEVSVKSDKAGQVLKLLFDDGEAVAYGDPIIALLP